MDADGSYEQIRPDEGEEFRSAQQTFVREAERPLDERDENAR